MREASDSAVTATAADDAVRVTLHANGLIDSIGLDPRVKRLPVDDLAAAITKALAAAQQELLRRATDRDHESGKEAAGRLSAELEQINAEYLRKMAVYEANALEIIRQMEG
jgi:DNA-binding protein YbaB